VTYSESTPAEVFAVDHFQSNQAVESSHKVDKDDFVKDTALDADGFEWEACECLSVEALQDGRNVLQECEGEVLQPRKGKQWEKMVCRGCVVER
jgi:hypothetical protein